jgi:hypothetical protein
MPAHAHTCIRPYLDLTTEDSHVLEIRRFRGREVTAEMQIAAALAMGR